MSLIRIDRVLNHMGYGSRRELKREFRRGAIVLNGQTISSSKTKMDPEKDVLLFYGEEVVYRPYIYLLLNKPQGWVSSTEGPDSVLNLVSEYGFYDLHLVGRLDKDTTGFLLITNDGDYTHQITSPKSHIPKRYLVELARPLEESYKGKFRQGIFLEEEGLRTRPADLEIIGTQEAILTLSEGKYHQVKRMFLALGNEVINLHRLSIGLLELGDLALGDYVELGAEELEATLVSWDLFKEEE